MYTTNLKIHSKAKEKTKKWRKIGKRGKIT